MAVTEYDVINGSTIGSSEYSVINDSTSIAASTDPGCYQLIVDASSMVKGDEYRIRAYEKCRSGGTQRMIMQWTLLGAQTELFVGPPIMLMYGWDFTIQKIAGSDQTFDASIRKAG